MAAPTPLRALFGRSASTRSAVARSAPTRGERSVVDTVDDRAAARDGFGYLPAGQVYLDSACQTLRPQPVIDALTEYFTEYGACGDRVVYAWGRRVEDAVASTRDAVIDALGLAPRRYVCSFTLNTTYGLNLLLQQLPIGRYARVVTTHTEHNAVFLSTITAARRLGVPRVVLDRAPDGSVLASDDELADAVVVVSAMDNVTGRYTSNLPELVADVHRRGGTVIVDAAQAAPHALSRLRALPADAICFSAHKMYGPSLGVVVATTELLSSLELSFVGGGQIASVADDGFELLPDTADLRTRLEPGLQAWGEIIAFGRALEWLRPRMMHIERTEARLSERLFEGLRTLPRARVLNAAAAPVVSLVPERVDAHRLAVFLSQAGISVRSGYFCAHHWLQGHLSLAPLVRFSVGAHSTDDDIDRALSVMTRMMRGL